MTHSLVDDLATILAGKLGRNVGVHRYSSGRGWRYNLIFETSEQGLPSVFRDLSIDQAKGRLNTLIDLFYRGVITSGQTTGGKIPQQDAQGSGTVQHQRTDLRYPSSGSDRPDSLEALRSLATEIVETVCKRIGIVGTGPTTDWAVIQVVAKLQVWTDAHGSPGPIDATT